MEKAKAYYKNGDAQRQAPLPFEKGDARLGRVGSFGIS